jgi:hypothetical protein
MEPTDRGPINVVQPVMKFYYKNGRRGSSDREDLEASFARYLPSHYEYVVGQVV